MNWLDTVFIIILLLSFLSGFKKGLVLQLIDLFAFIVSWYLAIKWGGAVGINLVNFFNLEAVIDSLDFIHLKEYVIMFLGVIAVLVITGLVFAVLRKILNSIARIPVLKSFNALLGGTAGLLKGILFAVIFTIFLFFLHHPFIDQAREGSFIYAFFSQYASVIIDRAVDMLIVDFPLLAMK